MGGSSEALLMASGAAVSKILVWGGWCGVRRESGC